MEKKIEAMKAAENNNNNHSSNSIMYTDQALPYEYMSHFESHSPSRSAASAGGGGGGCDKSSYGFMDLLGLQDFGSSIFDFLQQSPPLQPPPALTQPPPSVESSEVLNLPATPNSSSISSSSNEVATEGTTKVVVEEEEQQQQHDKTKKQLKPKKKNQKRPREPRFAFMTKSDVDHLEDGYRWRKYGQKAVKNSPFPRSYYRCTNATCGVKKRVERSCDDPSTVVTTYEGQHTHQSPVVPRGGSGGLPRDSGHYAMPIQIHAHYQQQLLQQQQQAHFHSLQHSLSFNSPSSTPSSVFTTRAAMLRDHGLLQDLVPKELKEE